MLCCVIDLLQRTKENLLPYLVLCACTSYWMNRLLCKIGSCFGIMFYICIHMIYIYKISVNFNISMFLK